MYTGKGINISTRQKGGHQSVYQHFCPSLIADTYKNDTLQACKGCRSHKKEIDTADVLDAILIVGNLQVNQASN